MTQSDTVRRIEVVRRRDCVHGVAAVAAVRRLADRLGVPVVVQEVIVETEADAHENRCIGSPTVLIDGQDVEPSARGLTSFGMT